MRILHSIFVFLALALALPIFVRAAERIPVSHEIHVTETSSGRAVSFPAGKGYTLETVTGPAAAGKTLVHIFDPNGMQIQGDFQIADDQLPLQMGDQLNAVFKAEAGAEMKPGCCDVVEPRPEPKDPPEPLNPTRAPAIAPGSHIIYADDGVSLLGSQDMQHQVPSFKPLDPLDDPASTRKPAVVEGIDPDEDGSEFLVPGPYKKETVPLPPKRPAAPLLQARPSLVVSPSVAQRAPAHVAAIPSAPSEPNAHVASTPAPSSGGMCGVYNQFRAKGVPDAPLRQALTFLATAKASGKISSSSHLLAISDYSQNSREKRFYLLDLRTGTVTQEKVSHGSGKTRRGNLGDPTHDGMLNRCGDGKNLTRTGFFRVGDYYFSHSSHFGWPLLTRQPPRNGVRLNGLSPTNISSFQDGVVFHEAKYNRDGNALMGRSFGCPAFVPGHGAPLLAKMVDDESLYYSYAPQCSDQMAPVLNQVRGWESFCK